MKLYSTNGKGIGKKGSSVFSINHGVQIEREYNGCVHNPNTAAQVEQRSRFKLASQISVALADVIAIPRKGIYSPRNRWTKHNFPYFYGNEEGAQVTYELLQLTLGTLGLPAIELKRSSNDKLQMGFVEKVYPMYDRIVWCIFKKNDNGTLQLIESVVKATEEDTPYMEYTRDDIAGSLLIYAYGMHDRNADATYKYGNYNVKTGADVARLVASRKITATNYAFSITQGATLAAGQDTNVIPTNNTAVLNLSVSGQGSIKQGETVICKPGSSVTLSVNKNMTYNLSAVADDEWHFSYWQNANTHEIISHDRLLQISGAENGAYMVRFDPGGGLE